MDCEIHHMVSEDIETMKLIVQGKGEGADVPVFK
jgi:hypothetical protein